MKFIAGHRNLTLEDKLSMKCGFDYTYLAFIRSNTPDSSVIAMVDNDVLRCDGTPFNVSNSAGAGNKAWATYFLYPRKLVYSGDGDIDFVAVANYSDCFGNKYDTQLSLLRVEK